MSPFWTSLFDHLRNCGRNAALFLFALAGCFAVLALCAMVCQSELQRFIVPFLPGLGLLAVAWVCLAIRRARVRRRERLLRPPLSDDELRAARSKLRKARRRTGAPSPYLQASRKTSFRVSHRRLPGLNP